jgi:xylose isomerase
MRNYLIFKERAAGFRADPAVAEAYAQARADQLAQPTLAPGESLDALRAEDFDVDAAAARGCGYERLDQLATDHLLGIR